MVTACKPGIPLAVFPVGWVLALRRLCSVTTSPAISNRRKLMIIYADIDAKITARFTLGAPPLRAFHKS